MRNKFVSLLGKAKIVLYKFLVSNHFALRKLKMLAEFRTPDAGNVYDIYGKCMVWAVRTGEELIPCGRAARVRMRSEPIKEYPSACNVAFSLFKLAFLPSCKEEQIVARLTAASKFVIVVRPVQLRQKPNMYVRLTAAKQIAASFSCMGNRNFRDLIVPHFQFANYEAGESLDCFKAEFVKITSAGEEITEFDFQNLGNKKLSDMCR